MSDGRKPRGKYTKWILLLVLVLFSPVIGIFLDVFVLFPPSADAHGHGIPVFTILLPLVAGFTAVIVILVTAVSAAANAGRKAASLRGKHYEYSKVFWKYSNGNAPVLLLHEIDLDAGRQGIRCIEIYPDGHAEYLESNGLYAPVPTVEEINASPDYTAYLITGQEFEAVWNGNG